MIERISLLPKVITQLDAIINLINNGVGNYTSVISRPKFNSSQIERQAMIELKNNDSLHITKADKGGAFLILNNDFYITEMNTEHTPLM